MQSGRQNSHRYQRITIVGCGLIGSSFALALRSVCPPEVRITGWDAAPQVLHEALQRGVIDEVDAPLAQNRVPASDLIYLAMPVAQIIAFLRDHGAELSPHTTITDAGSTKLEICRAARAYLAQDCEFIGGHPIAGSHLAGPAYARADLFEGAAYVLTPHRESAAFENFAQMIKDFRAEVHRMDAAEHDRALAFVSHLPQLMSSALAATVNARDNAAQMKQLSGTGYRDMTRLAASSWSIWRDILASNSEPIAEALDDYIDRLSGIRDELRRHDQPSEARLDRAQALFHSA